MIFEIALASSASRTVNSHLVILEASRFELISLLPADQLRKTGSLPTQSEAKPRHRAVAGEIHLGMIFIAGLVVVLFDILAILSQAPRFIVPLEFHPLVDREGGNSDARQAKVIRPVKVPSLG